MSADAEFWSRQSRVSYFWLQEGLEADVTFAAEAMEVLKRLRPLSTYTTASSATGLLNHWAVERELTVFERGEPVDVAAVKLYPDENGDYTAADNAVEQGWRIDRAAFVALLTQYRMTVPSFVNADAPPADDAKTYLPVWTDKRKEELREEHKRLIAEGHKSPTKELARKYDVSETRIRDLKSEPVSKPNSWNDLAGK